MALSEPRQSLLTSVAGLRAWKLALAGPSLFWYLPIFFVLLSGPTSASPLGLTALMLVMMVSAAWGFLLNDLGDRESDSKSGRADVLHGHGLSRRTMLALIVLTAGVSWATVFLIVGGGYVFKLVLAFDYLVSILYSTPPFKLKIRKVWGFISNSLMERPLPILVFLSYMNYYTYATIALPIMMELTWSVFKHQAADIKEDIDAKVTTFAVSLGERLSTTIVTAILNPLSVFSLLFLIAMAWEGAQYLGPIFGATFVVSGVAILVAFLGERFGKLTVYITPTDPPYIIALNLSYRYVVLPAMAYGVLAYRGPYFPLLILLALALGYQTLSYAKIARRVFA